MYKHFTAANEYFVESKASMEYEPELVQALDAIFVGATEVQRQVRDRAKLGSTAATSVPISLTGKKPKRSDILGRWSGLPKRDARLIPLPQPIFDNPASNHNSWASNTNCHSCHHSWPTSRNCHSYHYSCSKTHLRVYLFSHHTFK